MAAPKELLIKLETLQNMLLSRATGGDMATEEYQMMRGELLAVPNLKDRLPRFISTCRTPHQFWDFIKAQFGSYAQRRQYIWDEFRPAFEWLENAPATPSDESVTDILSQFDTEHIQQVWTKALARRTDDPDGAITLARTLLESVCKHVLDESGTAYEDDHDLPKIYRATATVMHLAPSQQSEDIFRKIFGSCQAIVEGLGTMRNKLSDAHGKGKAAIQPLPRHAELAVNLSGAMAMFLLDTWRAQSSTKS